MEKYNVKFKKKFGQNFLKDDRVVKEIVDISGITNNDLAIEVGPGGGILTKELANQAKHVLAYEIDTDLSNELSQKLSCFNNIDILFKDFLQSDIKKDIENYQYDHIYFISNVPYYITTPIVMKLIDSGINFQKIIMMVQKEVGDRFSSQPGSKSYSSISVFLGYYYHVKKEFFVSKDEFIPKPNVDSVIISFTERKEKEEVLDLPFFHQLVRDSFQFKRKNLKNNLKKYDLQKIASVLEKYGYDLSVRAEQLDIKIFVDIANYLVI